jgi:hypothetical protein
LVLFTWQSDVARNVEDQEVGDPMHAGNHAVANVQVPPCSAPALLENWISPPMHGCERASIQVDFESDPLAVSEQFPCSFLLTTAVEGNDDQQQCLDKKPIFRSTRQVAQAGGLVQVHSSGGTGIEV